MRMFDYSSYLFPHRKAFRRKENPQSIILTIPAQLSTITTELFILISTLIHLIIIINFTISKATTLSPTISLVDINESDYPIKS